MPRLSQLTQVVAGIVLITLGVFVTGESSLSLLGTVAIIWVLVP